MKMASCGNKLCGKCASCEYTIAVLKDQLDQAEQIVRAAASNLRKAKHARSLIRSRLNQLGVTKQPGPYSEKKEG